MPVFNRYRAGDTRILAVLRPNTGLHELDLVIVAPSYVLHRSLHLHFGA